jgi:hypothetical protein
LDFRFWILDFGLAGRSPSRRQPSSFVRQSLRRTRRDANPKSKIENPKFQHGGEPDIGSPGSFAKRVAAGMAVCGFDSRSLRQSIVDGSTINALVLHVRSAAGFTYENFP